MTEPHDEDLSARPGTQAGWVVPLEGEFRCSTYGHELDARCDYSNGLIVGYCVRCSDRVEIPWFRGGTIAALARYMVTDAARLTRPKPSVLTDLEQVAGLLTEDIAMLNEMRRQVRRMQHEVLRKIGLG